GAEEEARLAFLGATAGMDGPARRLVAVVDVGGGSAQIAVGTRRDGPAWARSLDVGSMRLTSRLNFADPPGRAALAAARQAVEGHLAGVVPPLPHAALAVGGSARALKDVGGTRLGAAELEGALSLLAALPAKKVTDLYGVEPERVATLPAGAVILAGINERLGVPFRIARGGVREGALLELARRQEAA